MTAFIGFICVMSLQPKGYASVVVSSDIDIGQRHIYPEERIFPFGSCLFSINVVEIYSICIRRRLIRYGQTTLQLVFATS